MYTLDNRFVSSSVSFMMFMINDPISFFCYIKKHIDKQGDAICNDLPEIRTNL